MSNEIHSGDFVRIPQLVTLYKFDDTGVVETFFKCPKPLAAIFLGNKSIQGTRMKELLLDNQLWYAHEEDIHKWRDYANKND